MRRILLIALALLGLSAAHAAGQQVTFSNASTLREGLADVMQSVASEQPGEVIATLASLELSTAPLGSSSGGFTFTFEPTTRSWNRTASTFGPAFSERALTIGRAKVSLGFNVLAATYDELEGTSLDKFRVTTISGNGQPPVFRLSDLGLSPVSELHLDLSSQTSVLFGSAGLTDRIEVGAAVPIVRVSLGAASVGYDANLAPQFSRVFRKQSSTGLGDIALFGKYRFWTAEGGGGAVAVDLRLPTGDEDNLRGLGVTRTLVSAVWSGTMGRVSPHFNVGYEFWSHGIRFPEDAAHHQPEAKDQVKFAAGLEYEISPKLTLLGDFVGRTIRGAGRLEYQTYTYTNVDTEAVKYGIGSLRTVVATSTNLTELSIAPGVKWNAFGSALIVANLLIPVDDSGLRDRLTPVVGINWAF